MLGDGHGRVGRLASHQGRRVRCRDHHHRPGQARLPQIVFQELPHLASAFSDQGNDRDVAVGVTRQHREQGGLADARACEQAEALSGAAGREAVEHAHAQIEARPETGAAGGIGGCRAHRPRPAAARQRTLAVERTSERVDHPAEPPVGDGQAAAPGGIAAADIELGDAARAQPVERSVDHRAGPAVAETDDFGRHGLFATRMQHDPVADGDMAVEPGQFDRQTGHTRDAAADACGRQRCQPIANRLQPARQIGHAESLQTARRIPGTAVKVISAQDH